MISQSLRKRSRELGRRRFHPWTRRRWSKKMAEFATTGASQLARANEKNEERTTVLGVSSARLVAVGNNDDGRWLGS
jgi:hypothetical protein